MRILPLILLISCAEKDDIVAPPLVGADCSEREYTLPSTRGEVAGVWDAARARMVFFGGDEGMPVSCIPKPEFTGEVWAFHPDCNNFELLYSWLAEALESEAVPNAPHPRSRHAIALDEARGRMLVSGGRYRASASGDYDLFDDLWALDLATDTWAELPSEDAPRKRVTHTMVVAGDQALIYGGNSTESATNYVPLADLWSYDLVDGVWAELDSDTPAGARLFHTATVSDDGSTMFIYGGANENALFGPFFDDLWAYDVASAEWTELHSGGSSAPDGRIMPNLLFDGTHNRLLLWSGHDDGSLGNTNQVWAFDLDAKAWDNLEGGDEQTNDANGFCDFPADFVDIDADAPERRYFGSAVLSEDELLVFGGKTDCGQVNDVWGWSLDGESWTERSSATFGEVCLRASAGDCSSLCY